MIKQTVHIINLRQICIFSYEIYNFLPIYVLKFYSTLINDIIKMLKL